SSASPCSAMRCVSPPAGWSSPGWTDVVSTASVTSQIPQAPPVPATTIRRSADERLGRTGLAGRAARGQRVLRRRRVRGDLRAPLADRAARGTRFAFREDRAVRDGACHADAGDLAAGYHDLLAADPERVRAGDPPPA